MELSIVFDFLFVQVFLVEIKYIFQERPAPTAVEETKFQTTHLTTLPQR
jgi:hypothetical protein